MSWAEAAAGADVEAGRQKAQVCFACHGPAGNSTNPVMPSLAGQPAQFITTALVQFRDGNRKDAQMTPIAASISNADMNDLAAYFAAQKPEPSNTRRAKTQPANIFERTSFHFTPRFTILPASGKKKKYMIMKHATTEIVIIHRMSAVSNFKCMK